MAESEVNGFLLDYTIGSRQIQRAFAIVFFLKKKKEKQRVSIRDIATVERLYD